MARRFADAWHAPVGHVLLDVPDVLLDVPDVHLDVPDVER